MCKDTAYISFPALWSDVPHIVISGSKSQTNRYVTLRAVVGSSVCIKNSSDSDDAASMRRVIDGAGRADVIDIGHAGTAMRFGTAYLASREGVDVLLTGSSRMCERPISELVDALRQLGASIEYEGKEGYPPLRIKGRKISGGRCSMSGEVSSQYISAIMLASPSFEKGVEINLTGRVVSVPYIKMTLGVLEDFGIKGQFTGSSIVIPPSIVSVGDELVVESDWSSASYYYSMVATSGRQVRLSSFRRCSTQGDSRIVDIYRAFGVDTEWGEGEIKLSLVKGFERPRYVDIDMEDTPDVAQSVAVTMAALGIRGRLTGLSTLRVKETDRIAALEAELSKFGVKCSSTIDTLSIEDFGERKKDILLNTYQDHRMAMAFVPMALCGGFYVENPAVVSKSYTAFWEDMEKLGLELKK